MDDRELLDNQDNKDDQEILVQVGEKDFNQCCDELMELETLHDKLCFLVKIRPNISWETFKQIVPDVVNFESADQIKHHGLDVENLEQLIYLLDFFPETDYESIWTQLLITESIEKNMENALLNLEALFNHCKRIPKRMAIYLIMWDQKANFSILDYFLEHNLLSHKDLIGAILTAFYQDDDIDNLANAFQKLELHNINIKEVTDRDLLREIFKVSQQCPKRAKFVADYYDSETVAKIIMTNISPVEGQILSQCADKGVDLTKTLSDVNK
jgi:hypothetical protein